MCMRGDIYCVELKSYEKHVQKGKRPVLVTVSYTHLDVYKRQQEMWL